MKISVIGTGYVGLVTGTCLAEMGNHVLCLDVDEAKINTLRNGEVPFYEPGLDTMVQRNVESGRLLFTTSPEESAQFGEVQFIAVGTPPEEDGSADLQYVLAAARNIGRVMNGYRLIINKSTVPLGTAEKVRQTVQQELDNRQVDYAFDVVSNPEFLKEGSAVNDFMRPDRIIIGCDNPAVEEKMRQIYEPFQRMRNKIQMMDIPSAELTKYAANAMLATRISFMNELARLAEVSGADIEQVRQGIGSDPRIGFSFLYAGCGYGGSCLPKDVNALIRMFDDNKVDAALLKAVNHVNDKQKTRLTERVIQRFGDTLAGKRFAVWGLAFKPETDDVREAPSRVIIRSLLDRGAQVCVFDPIAESSFKSVFGAHASLAYAKNPYDALKRADALLIVTEWRMFRNPDFEKIYALLQTKVIIDGRNLYDPALMAKNGFEYYPIGRQAIV